MGLMELFQSLFQNPVGYNNVMNSSYDVQPVQRPTSSWGFGGSRPSIYDQRQVTTEPDLTELLLRQGVETQPYVQQEPNLEALRQILMPQPQRRQQQQQIRPQRQTVQQPSRQSNYDYDAIARFAEPAYREGPNENIQEDSRARAMAWLAKQQGG